MDAIKTKYDAMISRVKANGNQDLAKALTEERDEKLLALGINQSEAEVDRLLRSAATGLAWGHWNT